MRHPELPARPSLWQCPRCLRRFASRNQSHACGRYELEPHFEGKPPAIRAIFDRFLAALLHNGPVTVIPERSRIAFQVRMSFAQLTPRRQWVDGHLVLARRVDSPVFSRIESFSPRNHLHAFRLRAPRDITRELRRWMAEAYAVGDQLHLSAAARSSSPRKRSQDSR
jgi:hypothetical protein